MINIIWCSDYYFVISVLIEINVDKNIF